MRSPFLGPAYSAESLYLADQQCINLYPELVDTHTGKDVGAFFMCPGLDLLLSCGAGPIRGLGMLNGIMYVVSGNEVYSVDTSYTATLLGAIGSATGPVSFFNNLFQLVMIDGIQAYLLPPGKPMVGAVLSSGGIEAAVGDVITLSAIGGDQIGAVQITITSVGTGLSGGSPANGGQGYKVNDTITLVNIGGTQIIAAVIEVTQVGSSLAGYTSGSGGIGYVNGDSITLINNDGDQVSPITVTVTSVGTGGVVTGATITNAGAFLAQPTGFTQAFTSGSGSGYTAQSPAYNQGAVAAFNVVNAGSFTSPTTGFGQASTSGGGSGFTMNNPAFATTSATGFSITAFGSFTANPSSLVQASTTGSGSGITLNSLSFGATQIYVIPIPFANALDGTVCDGFGLIVAAGTQFVYQSEAGDLSVWPALNFSSADAQGDYLFSIHTLYDQVWMVSQLHTEIWADVGQSGFSFQRIQGSTNQHGIAAAASLAEVGDSLACLMRDDNGQGVVVLSSGYNWARISTHALEYAMTTYATIDDAIAFSYQQSGHLYYFLTFPTADVTWVYDATASAEAKVPMWHQRAAWDGTNFHRHWANCFLPFNDRLVVGDYRNGNVYAFDLQTKTDNGTTRKWLRTWRARKNPTQQPQRFPGLVIDMQTGLGVSGGTPHVTLEWSDDGGNTLQGPQIVSCGAAGETALRVLFTRIGSTRRNSGLDRILFLSSTSQFSVALIGAEFLDEGP